jgi:hypothetical protein
MTTLKIKILHKPTRKIMFKDDMLENLIFKLERFYVAGPLI